MALARALLITACAVLVAVAGIAPAMAVPTSAALTGARAPGVPQASTYDTAAYTYDAPVLLSSPNTAPKDARGSPAAPDAGSWLSPAPVRDRVVAANTAEAHADAMPAGRYRPWMFGPEALVGAVADDLVAVVAQYRTRYVERHGSLAAIVEAMAGGEGVREAVALRLPVGYLLPGEAQRSLGALEASEAAIVDRQGGRPAVPRVRRRLNVSRGD